MHIHFLVVLETAVQACLVRPQVTTTSIANVYSLYLTLEMTQTYYYTYSTCIIIEPLSMHTREHRPHKARALILTYNSMLR